MQKHLILLIGLMLWIMRGIAQPMLVNGPYINELSQGPSGAEEFVEIMVYGDVNCNDTCFDLRGWILDDNNGYFANGGGTGIATGSYRFGPDPIWECVRYGTLIVIYNEFDRNVNLPPDDLDPSDGVMILPANSILFERAGGSPSASGSPNYPTTNWLTRGSWQNTLMSNSNDSYQIRQPNNLNGLISPFHAISFGNNTNNPVIYFPGSAGGKVFYMDNSFNNNPFDQANWSEGSAAGGDETPGFGNNPANSAWIQGVFAAANSAGLPIRDTVNVEGCDSAQYQATVLFNDTTFTDTLLTVDGCDSIVTYNYTINPSPSINLTIDNAISCFASNDGQISATLLTGNYDWIGASGFSQSSTNNVISNLGPDTYTLVFTDDNGCSGQDSVLLNEPTEIRTVSVQSACDSALIHGNWVFTPGNYVDTQQANNGCDSISIIDLALSNSSISTTTLSGCNSLDYNGQTFLSDTIIRDTFQTIGGCDSVVIAELNIPSDVNLNLTIQDCLPIIYNGITYTSSTTIRDTFLSSNGCDSIVSVELIIGSSIFTNFDEEGCDSVFTNGQWFYGDTVLRDTFVAASGCDSIVTTTITVSNPSFEVSFISSCDDVTLNGQVFLSDTIFNDTLISVFGCDSIIERNLTILQPSSSILTDSLCPDSSYTLPDGSTASNPGTYSVTLINNVGCDSLVTVNLFSRSSPFIQLIDYDSSLCEGEQYFIDLEDYTGLLGEWITPTSPNALQLFEESGDYIYSLRNGINGCPVLDTVSIEFIFCDNSCMLNFPSAFTPNYDGNNEVFKPVFQECNASITQYELSVYNRWGELVFYSDDLDLGWNGMVNQEALPIETYIYTVKYRKNKDYRFEGNVTLLR
ncbi:MAG: gliding motility-associated C-terminal domain-containing protein [Chitinophagales bacterium]